MHNVEKKSCQQEYHEWYTVLSKQCRHFQLALTQDDQPDMPSTERFKKSAPKDQAPIWSERYNSSIQPLYIHLVGVDHDSAERAIADLGDLGEELILTSGLEVCPFARLRG